jgi:dihydrofolate reductase
MINALFAVDYYGGMGVNGTLPWPHNSADMANFKRLTDGHVVVMGRNTWDDPKMPKPLPGRTVYVATTRSNTYASTINGDINEAILKIEKQHLDKIIWVIGGANLLEQCSDIFDNLYLTHFKGSYKVDTKINLKTMLVGWQPVRAEVSPDFSFTLIRYENLFKRSRTST